MALWNITDSLLDTAYEIKNSGKKQKIFKCLVYLIDDHYNIEEYKGMLSDSKEFAFIPDLKRVIVNPVVFNLEGKKVIYLPEGSTDEVNYKFLKGLALAQCNEAIIKWHHLRKWITIEVKTKGSIDWTILNDKTLSRSFSTLSHTVIQSKVLTFLKDTSDLKLLFAMLFALAFGYGAGFTTSTIINIVYRLIQ